MVSIIGDLEGLCGRRLEAVEEVVTRWGLLQGAAAGLVVRDDGVCGSPELIAAVRELLFIISNGGIHSHRAEIILQTAIPHLEEEFRQVLIIGTNLHPPDNLQASLHDNIVLPARSISFSSFANVEAMSVSSFSTTPTDGSQTYCTGFSIDSLSMEQVYLYLIDPEAAIMLKQIAELIIRAGRAPNLCNVYSETRHNSLMQCLCLLGVPTEANIHSPPAVTSEGGYNMQLHGDKVKLWIRGLKIIVGTVLSEERQACSQIFGCDEMVERECFTRATTRCTKQLLAFGSAIAKVEDYHYEKVSLLLQMYEELANLQPSLQVLISGDAKDVICQETSKLLDRLRDASRYSLLEFSKLQFDYKPYDTTALDGSIPSLTQFVMGFLKLLADHRDLLSLILPLQEEVEAEEDDLEKTILPWERYALRLLSRLQLKIVEKSEAYKDERLQYIFLMNNAMWSSMQQRTFDAHGLQLFNTWIIKLSNSLNGV
ncbi:hypothetical protein QOZ80_6AG0515940 [Eleusine coracana subsp. coracana]|nr:hypothetical protein QOZ80_6AG0515940 [Eleusine coracana subsp. coracana]